PISPHNVRSSVVLPGGWAAADDQVDPGPDRGTQERRQAGAERARAGQIIQAHLTAANRAPSGPPAGSRRFSIGVAAANSRRVCPNRAATSATSRNQILIPATGYGHHSTHPSATSNATRSWLWMWMFSTSSRPPAGTLADPRLHLLGQHGMGAGTLITHRKPAARPPDRRPPTVPTGPRPRSRNNRTGPSTGSNCHGRSVGVTGAGSAGARRPLPTIDLPQPVRGCHRRLPDTHAPTGTLGQMLAGQRAANRQVPGVDLLRPGAGHPHRHAGRRPRATGPLARQRGACRQVPRVDLLRPGAG